MNLDANLRLVLGPAASGKTTQLLDRYSRALRPEAHRGAPMAARRRNLWLAPTQAAANDVRDRLAAIAPTAVLDPGVLTFAGFAAALVWDTGLRVRPISTLQRRRLLRQVIDEIAAEGALVHFAQVAGTPGMVSLADETIADLKRRDIFVEKFRRQVRGGGARLEELAEIYRRYQARLTGAKLVDAEGLFRTARDGLDLVPQAASGLELVVVDGFTDFTSAQLDILSALAERAGQMWVSLPADDAAVDSAAARTELFAKPLATAAALRRLGAVEVRASENHREDVRHGGSSTSEWPAMSHLERNLFRAYRQLEQVPPAAAETSRRIQIFAASSVQAEIEHIAREVKKRLLAGAAPEEIVVAFRSTHEAADRLRQAFAEFGIPFHLDASPRLSAAPVIRSLLGVLRLAGEDWPYRRVLAVAGDRRLTILDAAPDGPASWSSEPAPKLDPRTAIERCVRHAQLPQGRAALFNQLGLWAAAAAEEDADPPIHSPLRAAALAQYALSRFAAALDELPSRADAQSWLAAVERLAGQIGVLGAATTLDDVADWQVLADGVRSSAQIDAWTGLNGAQLTLPEFAQLVTNCAMELPASGKPRPTGRVRIASAEAARFLRPKHLVVGGLSEQSFPATPGRNIDVEAIGAGDSTTSPSRQEDFRAGEMLLFYQLVTRPTESLLLSYPALDAKAQPMMPSPYLVELERCFKEAPLEHVKQPLSYRAAATETAAPMSRGELRRAAVLRALDDRRELLASLAGSPAVAPAGQAILAGLEAVASRGGREFGAFEGIFASDAVRLVLEKRFDLTHLWSPSHLETYAGCPFRFFGEQVLKLQPAPELALQSDAAHRGAVLHETLAQLYGRLSELPRDQPLSAAELASHFKETLEAVMERRPGSGLEAALREIEHRQIASWAELFAEQHERYGAAWTQLDEPLTPKHFEYRFGPKRRRDKSTHDPKSTDEPLVISAGEAEFRFTGVVDRIDVGRVGETVVFNVIDYKSSARARVREDEMAAGRQLQLQLYALAVSELLFSGQAAAPLAAGFWSVQGKGFDGGVRTKGPLALGEVREGAVAASQQWTQMRDVLLGRIREMVAAIRSGWFPVFNDNPDCGRFCPFNTVCRIGHVRSLEKQWLPSVEAPQQP